MPSDTKPDPSKSSGSSPPELPDVLTVEEAALYLRVNTKTLYAAIQVGQVPGVMRVGRAIRLSRHGLINWSRGDGHPLKEQKP